MLLLCSIYPLYDGGNSELFCSIVTDWLFFPILAFSFNVGHFFKVFIEFFYNIGFVFMFLLFWLQGMWDPSVPTRAQTLTPCIGRWSSKPLGPSGKSYVFAFM